MDQRLPAELARWIQTKGRDACHALDVGMALASDIEVFLYAESSKRILVSKDEDFLHLTLRSKTVRFIWVRVGNCRKPQLLDAFERAWPHIMERLESGDRFWKFARVSQLGTSLPYAMIVDMQFPIELDREAAGRWIAALPGLDVLFYGATKDDGQFAWIYDPDANNTRLWPPLHSDK